MKKYFLVLMVALVSSAVAFGATTVKEGEAFGYRDNVKVILEMDGKTIKDVKIEHKDSPKVADPAIVEIKKDILKKQNANIDNYAGATYTTNGVKEALKKALAQ